MEQPRIQYAKTADGVNIAYAVVGSGQPIVFASNIFGNLHMAQAGVLTNAWNVDDHLAAGRQVVLYDVRGAGSSDRNVEDFSLQARVLDLEAVVDAVGVAHFPLIGFGTSAHAAIAYAVSHPEAVSHLILANPFISGAEFYRTVPAMRAVKAMQGMAEDEWEYVTQSLAGRTAWLRRRRRGKQAGEGDAKRDEAGRFPAPPQGCRNDRRHRAPAARQRADTGDAGRFR